MSPRRIGLFLLILSPLAFLLVYDPIRRGAAPRPVPSLRPAEFRVCPQVSVRSVPRGIKLIRRELRNLGNNVMGRSIQYAGSGRRVWVAVGFEVLNALEDLDFTEESVQAVGGRRVSITATDIIAAHRVRAGVWQDERFEPPCGEFTLVTWNLTEKMFLDVVDGIQVVSGESRQGGIG